MKKKMLLILISFALGTILAPRANADLNGFLGNLNVQARADLPGFKAKMSAQFGIPVPHVEGVIDIMPSPADAFMCFQIGWMTGRSPRDVADVFNHNRGKGWGVTAKALGIKPGSAEFHALKRGDFALTGRPHGNMARDHGKSRNRSGAKGKSHGKGKKKK
ncbi:MAG: hypothetical protein P8X96_14295 [Desulfobacteraceae bacterium]